jgi:short-subunit dehydrogenase
MVARPAGAGGKVTATIDCSSVQSVDAFARWYLERVAKSDGLPHLLIMNAAVVTKESRTTGDGIEEMLQVNTLCHGMLMDAVIAAGANVQLVVVGSQAHTQAPSPFPMAATGLDTRATHTLTTAMSRYAYTKFAVSTLAAEASRRSVRPVDLYDPGPVATDIGREAPDFLKRFVIKPLFAIFFRTPRDAALPLLHILADRAAAGNRDFAYHLLGEQLEPRSDVLDATMGRWMWDAARTAVQALRQ